MTQWLKQSTAYTFQLGPFVDSGDGVTPETSLTIAATDVDLSKNGAAFGDKNDATALTGTGDAQGYYDCVLDTTDTGTLGNLDVRCYVSGALPVWKSFVVVPANVYNSLVLGTDYLDIETAAMAAGAVDTIVDEVVEGTLTLRQALRIMLSFVGAEVSGGGTSTVTFRDIGDTKARITMTVDTGTGDRSAVVLDGS